MSANDAATLAELVAGVATTDPHKAAIIFGDQSISCAQLDELIERAADGLSARGVRPGDRVALMVPNCPEFAIAYYAILRLGAIAAPVNVLYKSPACAPPSRARRLCPPRCWSALPPRRAWRSRKATA